MKFVSEFKEFAVKGNVIDMAIGVIVGTAFSKIVSSLVKDILTPMFALFLGRLDFSKLSFVIRKKVVDASGTIVDPGLRIDYGNFIQAAMDFLIISVCLFMAVKVINRLRRKSEDPKEKGVPTPTDIQLLREIRDLLKASSVARD